MIVVNGRPGRKSRTILLLAAVVPLFLPVPSEAASADSSAPASLRGACGITFFATSTLHDFSGSGSCRQFAVRIAHDAAGREVIPVVEVEVPVAGMSTRNGTRDRQMREMFESDRYPLIRGMADNVDVARLRAEVGTGKGSGGKAPIDFLLRIREVERKIHGMVVNLEESGDRVVFDIEFPLSLGQFDLKAPSVLGFIRVGDTIAVKVNFTLLVPRPPPGASNVLTNGGAR